MRFCWPLRFARGYWIAGLCPHKIRRFSPPPNDCRAQFYPSSLRPHHHEGVLLSSSFLLFSFCLLLSVFLNWTVLFFVSVLWWLSLQTDPQTWFNFSLRGTWPDLLTSICRESNRSSPSKHLTTTTTILPSLRCLEPIGPFPRPIKALFAASVDSNSSEGIVSPEDRCNDRVSLPLLYRRHSSPSEISRYIHNRSFIDRDIALHIRTGDI